MYNVIDEFLPKETFDGLKHDILSSRFPFFIENKVNNFETEENKFNWYATHTIYDDHKPESSYYEQIEKIFLNRINEHHYIKALIRIKVNFYPHSRELIEHAPHTDDTFSHMGAVFSLNTCDGFTRLSDGSIIDSVENRIVFFDASTSHNSTTTTTDIGRYNINFNFI